MIGDDNSDMTVMIKIIIMIFDLTIFKFSRRGRTNRSLALLHYSAVWRPWVSL